MSRLKSNFTKVLGYGLSSDCYSQAHSIAIVTSLLIRIKGMLASAEAVTMVSEALRRHEVPSIVLDPVFAPRLAHLPVNLS